MRKHTLSIVIFLILLALAYTVSTPLSVQAASSTDDWPMFHPDPAHTGYSTSSVPTTTPTVLWAFPKGLGGSPVVADGYIAIMDQNNVYCINASNGEKMWEQRLPNSAGDAAIYNGYVYTSSGAFNVSTGEMILNYTNNLGFTTPNVAEGIVYIGSCIRGGVFALNATTGAKIWDFTSSPVYSFPAVANGLVYFTSVEGSLYALNASTGAKIWNYTFPPIDYYITSSPAIVKGVIYVGNGHALYAFGNPTPASSPTVTPSPSQTIPEFSEKVYGITLFISMMLVTVLFSVWVKQLKKKAQ